MGVSVSGKVWTRVSQIMSLESNLAATCFDKLSFIDIQPHPLFDIMSVSAFLIQGWS